MLSFHLFIYLSILYTLFLQVHSQCCLQFNGSKCLKCPQNMHLFKDNCLFDVQNCLTYINGFDCALCRDGYLYNSVTMQCETQYLQLLNHHLVFLRPSISNYKLITSKQTIQNQKQINIRLDYQTQNGEIVWFQLKVDVIQLLFSLIRESGIKEQKEFQKVEVSQMMKDADFLLTLLQLEEKNKNLVDKTIEEVYRLFQESKTVYRIKFSSNNEIFEVSLDLTQKGSATPINNKQTKQEKNNKEDVAIILQNLIPDSVKNGQKLKQSQLQQKQIKLALNQALNNNQQKLNISQLVASYRNKLNPVLNTYNFYFSINNKFYEVAIFYQIPFQRYFVRSSQYI